MQGQDCAQKDPQTARDKAPQTLGQVGSRISDDLQFVERISKGTHASLYHAVCHSTKKSYAVKVVARAVAAKLMAQFGQRSCMHEARILESLKHPNIVQHCRTYTDNTNIYIVTEYLKGGDLCQAMQSDVNYSESDIRECGKCIISATRYLHSKGIVHRDIKLENIVLRSTSNITDVVLVDFGMSRHFTNESAMAECCGTMNYIAPEIVYAARFGGSYDEKVDIWCIGVVLFAMLFRRFPIDGELCGEEISERTLHGRLDFPRSTEQPHSAEGLYACADTPREALTHRTRAAATDLVRRLLCIDPDKRPACEAAAAHAWFAHACGAAAGP